MWCGVVTRLFFIFSFYWIITVTRCQHAEDLPHQEQVAPATAAASGKSERHQQQAGAAHRGFAALESHRSEERW